MSIVKAYDVAHVRFRAPDLGRMRAFLLDFGMIDAVPAQAAGGPLYMRGYDGAPYVHVTEEGDAGFIGFGIWVRDRADLEKLAAHDGVPVEPVDAPGGGLCARLTDPDGFVVEVIAAQDRVPALPTPAGTPWNHEGEYPRIGGFRRVGKGAAHVRRLGHVVLGVTDFRRSEAWYKERFGLVTSDEIQPAPGHAIGAFMRCDRGEESCDHHTVFLFAHPKAPTFMHAAFEVAGVDDLMAGHDHLLAAGHKPFWGVGRHLLGSQIFDYWFDPWGHEVEHWTDGDQLRARDGGGIASVEELMSVQWGMQMPPNPGAPEA